VANTLLTDQHITQEALMILENELVFTKQANRDYQSEFKGPAKRGATIYAKRPPQYTVRDGQNVSIQDTTITQVPVTLNHQFGVDVEFTSTDLTLSIDAFSEQILQPQIVQIAHAVDLAGLQLACQTGNLVGTPGTTPGTGSTAQASLAVYAQAQALLDKNSAPRDGKRAITINEDAQAITVPNLAGLLAPSDSISDQYKKGAMGTALGMKFGMSQNVNVLTTGTQGGTPLVAAAPTAQVGPSGTTLNPTPATFSITTKGWTPSIKVLNANDVVYFAGCYGVNRVTRLNYGKLKGFCVADDVIADGSGNATITVTEAMIVTGAFQNVTAVPATNAAITVAGGSAVVSPQNILMHGDAITLACVDLPVPGGMHMATRKNDKRLGLSLRFVAGYQISTDQYIGRFDLLCGWALIRPEWIVRVAG
jgi:hypothetical protein